MSSTHPSRAGHARQPVLALIALALAIAATCVVAATASAGTFGVQSFSMSLSTTQAGGHPDVTTSFKLPYEYNSYNFPEAEGILKDVTVDLPPGLVGDPTTLPRCSDLVINSQGPPTYGGGDCPATTQVGVIDLITLGFTPDFTGYQENHTTVPVFNMEPNAGQPARFAFSFAGVETVPIDIGIRPGDDAVRATLRNISAQLPVIGTSLTLWGNPADASHDTQRTPCISASNPTSSGACPASTPPAAFMTNPTRCDTPLTARIDVRSWNDHGATGSATSAPVQMTGCDKLRFAPSATVTADTTQAGAPSGLQVGLHVPRSTLPTKLAPPDLRDAVVTLPAGMTINPALADGLQGCTDAQFGQGSSAPVACPAASSIGTVQIDTPLLDDPLTGRAYVGAPASGDPASGKMYRLFLVAEGAGVSIRLSGSLVPDPATGQVTATFASNPQLPFDDLRLTLQGGSRAPLVTSGACRTGAAHVALTGWNGAQASSDAAMPVDQGCDRAGRFEPTLNAGFAGTAAGKSSSFVFDLARPDGQQDVGSLDVALPAGVLAAVGRVPLCPDAAAATGGCPAATQVGRATVASGAGSAPLTVPQAGRAPSAVYLAGPYKGAPYSLAIVVPAQAGPYDLGTVVVRAALHVDPVDAHVTVKSDPLPTILKGVPLRLQRIHVAIDRPGFMAAPTSCAPMEVLGRVASAAGTVAEVRSPLQMSGCQALGFTPSLKLALTGKGQTTDGKHPALDATLKMPAGHANLRRVAVALPLSMALDPDNAQSDSLCEFAPGSKALPECPKGSIVGTATANTPLLAAPLTGPVYFIKNIRTDPKSGRQIRTLPKLAIVLQGSGITLVLRATSTVVDEQLVATFDQIPDAPISDFKLHLNGGKKGILVVSSANLCRATQIAEQAATAQSGKVALKSIAVATPCALGVLSAGHTATTLRLKVGGLGAGRASVSGPGLVPTARTLGSATIATLTPRLTRGTRSALARGRDVRVTVRVAFTPKGTKKAKIINTSLTIHGRR